MRQILFNLDVDDPLFGRACAELAEGLTAINMVQLSTTPGLPCCLGCGGVRYTPPVICEAEPVTTTTRRPAAVGFRSAPPRRPPPPSQSCQRLLDARGLYRERQGTCFDLACERAARLRLARMSATVVVEQRHYSGRPLPGQFHAYVQTPQGAQDPSRELQERPGQCVGICGCTGGTDR